MIRDKQITVEYRPQAHWKFRFKFHLWKNGRVTRTRCDRDFDFCGRDFVACVWGDKIAKYPITIEFAVVLGELIRWREHHKGWMDYEEGMDEVKQELNTEMQEMAAMGVMNAMDIQGNINAISKRFKNSKATKKYVLLMTNDKEKGGVGLAVVSKLDGEIKGFIPMKFSKKDPSYTVDPFTNKLFWMPSLDDGKGSFGRFKDIKSMQNSGTVLSFDLNAL